jgi:hypothetical protein
MLLHKLGCFAQPTNKSQATTSNEGHKRSDILNPVTLDHLSNVISRIGSMGAFDNSVR